MIWKDVFFLRDRFGEGIHSCPCSEAAEDFAEDFNYQGNRFKVIIQCRINLNAGRTTIHRVELHGRQAEYYVTAENRDVRPYGILFKQIAAVTQQRQSDNK